MDKIFESKSLLPGFPNITVYASQVEFTTGLAYMKKKETILAKNIASVTTSGTSTQVTIATNDGKEYKLPTLSMAKRDQLQTAILSIVK